MCFSTAESHKSLPSFLREPSLILPHPFGVTQLFSHEGEVTSTGSFFFWGNEATKNDKSPGKWQIPRKEPPRQMLYYPLRQRQQRTDNFLYNAIISTFKAILGYPVPHFIQPWNFQDVTLFSILPQGYVPLALCDQMAITITEGDKNITD